jgi:glucose/arabinose dehydrogenase
VTDHEGAPQILDDERDDLIYRLRVVNRWTMSKIAADPRVNLSHQRVQQILERITANLPVPDIAAVRAESMRMLRHVQAEALNLAELQGAPVTAGKDGFTLYDPESGAVVRDYAGRNVALKLAIEADKEIRKLMGADAASKVESTATVRYELASIDPEALK